MFFDRFRKKSTVEIVDKTTTEEVSTQTVTSHEQNASTQPVVVEQVAEQEKPATGFFQRIKQGCLVQVTSSLKGLPVLSWAKNKLTMNCLKN